MRLLRALRFQAKLGFDFDKTLAKEFNSNNWQLLDQISAHRLYDETQKMFTGGYLSTLLPLLYEYGAINALFTNASNAPTNLMMSVAKTSDMRIKTVVVQSCLFLCGAVVGKLFTAFTPIS